MGQRKSKHGHFEDQDLGIDRSLFYVSDPSTLTLTLERGKGRTRNLWAIYEALQNTSIIKKLTILVNDPWPQDLEGLVVVLRSSRAPIGDVEIFHPLQNFCIDSTLQILRALEESSMHLRSLKFDRWIDMQEGDLCRQLAMLIARKRITALSVGALIRPVQVHPKKERFKSRTGMTHLAAALGASKVERLGLSLSSPDSNGMVDSTKETTFAGLANCLAEIPSLSCLSISLISAIDEVSFSKFMLIQFPSLSSLRRLEIYSSGIHNATILKWLNLGILARSSALELSLRMPSHFSSLSALVPSAHHLRSLELVIYPSVSQENSWLSLLTALLQECRGAARIKITGAANWLSQEDYIALTQALSNMEKLERFAWDACSLGLVSDDSTRLDATLDFVKSCPRLYRLEYLPNNWGSLSSDTLSKIGLELERHRMGYYSFLKDELSLSLLPTIIAARMKRLHFGKYIMFELLREKNGVLIL